MQENFEGESQGTFTDVVEGSVADALEGVAIDEPNGTRDAALSPRHYDD